MSNPQITATESMSRDGITIGLIDAMLSIAHALNERLASETRRMKRSKIEWEWFSDEVQAALADLAHNEQMLKLIRPYDEQAMSVIRQAAKHIEAQANG